jgi:outer membrane protein OmpA-like peptidoglycan-associated protein
LASRSALETIAQTVALASLVSIAACAQPAIEEESYTSFMMFFDRNSSDVSGSVAVLDEAAEQFKAVKAESIDVLAFRSRDEGSEVDNFRGDAVVMSLIARGVPKSAINVVARDAEAEVKIGDQVILEGSRRVEVSFLK